MRRHLDAFALILGCAVAASGCTYGHHYAHHLANPLVEQGRAMSLALAVQDQREYVNSGGRPDFVGFTHGGLGNAFDVTTASGQPLAADFATSIRRGLESAGYRVTPVRVMDRAQRETVARALTKTGAERLLAVQIDAWTCDTWKRTQFDYDVTLRVLDARGHGLGQARVSGSEVLGGDFVDPVGHAAVVLPRVYVQKLEQLLNDPAIKRGLLPTPPAPVPAPTEKAPAPVESPPAGT